MQITIALILLTMSLFSQAADTTAKKLYGYMNQNRSGAAYYVAVNINYLKTPEDYDPLEALIPENWFSRAQLDLIYNCMQNREQFVPVVERKYVPTVVPTGIPGRTTTTSSPVITKITCESKPGFIYTWRELVKKSAFH